MNMNKIIIDIILSAALKNLQYYLIIAIILYFGHISILSDAPCNFYNNTRCFHFDVAYFMNIGIFLNFDFF
jgi:hypothetical protein